MTKIFNFDKKNNNSSIFLGNSNNTNYSSILDDIITADVINKNKYLFKTTSTYDSDFIDSLIDDSPIVLHSSTLKASDSFTKAATFLANYKKYKKTSIPYIFGKMYTLSDGTPIVFYDDEIQIGFDTFKYSDFTNLTFLNGLTTKTKNLIINIYTNGISNININIL